MDGVACGDTSLCELLDRVLNTGVVASGDIVISVAGVDLLYLNLQLLLTSVERVRGSGRLPALGLNISPRIGGIS